MTPDEYFAREDARLADQEWEKIIKEQQQGGDVDAPSEVPNWGERFSEESIKKLQEESAKKKRHYQHCDNEKQRTHLDRIDNGTFSSEFLANLDLPATRKFIGTWYEEGDYGLIYAERGVGKTLYTLWLARALAYGLPLGEWETPEKRKVLYIDGEMNPYEMQQRMRTMDILTPNLLFVNHELFFRQNDSVLNLADKDQQKAMTAFCLQQEVNVLVCDNISCLFPGVEENSSDEFRDKILPWLLQLRRKNISVILVHHTGKDGKQRGCSGKEDQAAWAITLSRLDSTDGAKFISKFTKIRHGNFPGDYEWHFVTKDGVTSVGYKDSNLDSQILEMIRAGVGHNNEIAEHLGISKAEISRRVQTLINQGLVYKKGKEYCAGKAEEEREEGPKEVALGNIHDVILNIVRYDQGILAAELKAAAGKAGNWKVNTIEHAITELVEQKLIKEVEVDNPKQGRGQGAKTRAFFVAPETP